ncbi:MAG: MaoC family dehydratase N-terminal domain-containing protein [Armatimonadetes bacterium]|nr:MaoC family dehydratase N-terminal domain-containing protein [Armatimonadota bacterium]
MMSTLRINLDRLGRWADETVFSVDAARTKAYAAATNDDHPRHASGELAPPIFACVPMAEALSLAMDALVAREDRRWGLHASQDMHLHRPLVPGMVLHTRAAAIGVQPRASGAAVVIKSESRDAGGTLVNEQYGTIFFRLRFDGQAAGREPPDHRMPPEVKGTEPLITVTYRIDDDQTFRYADASGDRNPLHLSDEFARSVGLPGIVVHGMLTMALTGRAVIATVCGDDPARLRRLAVRFARPVLPGQEIATRIRAAGRRDARAVYVYDTLNPAGKQVVQDGLAEVDA